MHRHNGIYTLLPGAATGYYEQVQGTLAVTGKVHCDFVIWTMTGMLVIPVKFDVEFWANAKHQLQMFFEKFVVAEILTERVWRALPLFDDDDDDDDSVSCAFASASCVNDDPCVVGVQEFDDDIVLEDDKMEDSFLQGLELQPTSPDLVEKDDCDNSEICEPMYFDLSDFEVEETVDLNQM